MCVTRKARRVCVCASVCVCVLFFLSGSLIAYMNVPKKLLSELPKLSS